MDKKMHMCTVCYHVMYVFRCMFVYTRDSEREKQHRCKWQRVRENNSYSAAQLCSTATWCSSQKPLSFTPSTVNIDISNGTTGWPELQIGSSHGHWHTLCRDSSESGPATVITLHLTQFTNGTNWSDASKKYSQILMLVLVQLKFKSILKPHHSHLWSNSTWSSYDSLIVS